MDIRLASYNLHKCQGTDRRRDPGRVIDVLNSVEADVLALQEVDHRLGNRPEALPRRMIEDNTDFEAVDLALSPASLGWHGQTLLLRKGAELLSADRLHLPGLEPRGAVLAELTLPETGPLRVVGVHLGLIRRYRLKQLRAIRAALERRAPMQTVILGDFNEWSTDRGLEPLHDLFEVHAPGRSYHASRPVAALDRLALGQGVELRDAGVVETQLSRLASDHLPVWADVALNEN
ncbi:endonuclease/exonuclease/phosphatase family protein [Frigidibacter sp. ROC022]|uniref:endonuclease/exonuclease/phosphatase family protein n=1 Tax=Frigidibacter sp. ROC022 TaxID=2971796 RepID=UPI00215AB941|nr:endonuclease/exonuclease/phosphatase family protein [Frigidibacter sp. ROC022]MCR8725853.1 endonuclease/exonuclease/phosphatase family protein [Frigidibacter sp. ROC022]